MAIHLLVICAALRFIQTMLGLLAGEATQIFNNVSIRKSQAIHSATHTAGSEKKKFGEENVDKS